MIVVIATVAGALALGAVILLAVRRRNDAPIDTPEEAARAAETGLADFVVANALVGSDGYGALAIATDGRIAAIRRHGRRVAVHEVSWAAVRATGTGIVVETGERPLRALVIAGVDALDVRRLAAAGASPA